MHFNNIIKVLDACGASMGEDDGIMQKVLESQGIDPDATTPAQEKDAEEIGKEWYYTLAFLVGSD